MNKTKIINDKHSRADKWGSRFLAEGKIISFATETVYALACDATNDEAVKRLYNLKGRDKNKPTAIFCKSVSAAKEFLHFSPLEEKIARRFMPGMITMILKKKADSKIKISPLLNNDSPYIGLRIPYHDFSIDLLNEFGLPIAATSANISSQKAATTFEEAEKYFGGKIDLLFEGKCPIAIPSTVLKVVDNKIEIIRNGPISKEYIENLINEQPN